MPKSSSAQPPRSSSSIKARFLSFTALISDGFAFGRADDSSHLKLEWSPAQQEECSMLPEPRLGPVQW
eukprot:CAMPEP_0115056666 /NCGR_PEP_ID=MMETSP0227-20121206/5319_1 /TAXON_ID=89957 /ORGANISM="Polarella glacialis, Strain CCMP 1383" /LENGTH=67 /DNA_ID=CAMNT_0002441363 /DNA_START=317 /DNA_END=517 /DNA_ORIENTATION=-